jgi:hypothetical protein
MTLPNLSAVLSERSRASIGEDFVEDSLGLEIIYEPETTSLLDIIFIHGTGGSNHATWSKGRSPDKFWPQRWLPTEPGLRTARIFSFGYNESFGSAEPNPITNLRQYAKELLHCMKCASGEQFGELPLGNVRFHPFFYCNIFCNLAEIKTTQELRVISHASKSR